MAQFTVVKGPVFTRRFNVASGTDGSIVAGTPVKISGNNVVAVADADPVVETDKVVGIASAQSTETSSEAGHVDVTVIREDTVIRGPVKTASAVTASIVNNSVVFDVTSSVITVDAGATSAEGNGLLIVAVDTDNKTVDFIVKPQTGLGASTDA